LGKWGATAQNGAWQRGEAVIRERDKAKRAEDASDGGEARQKRHMGLLGEEPLSEGRASIGAKVLLRCRQTERGSKSIGNTEEFYPDVGSSRSTGIPCQSLLKRQTGMRPLREGEESGHLLRSRWRTLVSLDLDALVGQQVYACSSMLSSTPVMPKQGSRTD
jgi:hypothetical protein